MSLEHSARNADTLDFFAYPEQNYAMCSECWAAVDRGHLTAHLGWHRLNGLNATEPRVFMLRANAPFTDEVELYRFKREDFDALRAAREGQ